MPGGTEPSLFRARLIGIKGAAKFSLILFFKVAPPGAPFYCDEDIPQVWEGTMAKTRKKKARGRTSAARKKTVRRKTGSAKTAKRAKVRAKSKAKAGRKAVRKTKKPARRTARKSTGILATVVDTIRETGELRDKMEPRGVSETS